MVRKTLVPLSEAERLATFRQGTSRKPVPYAGSVEAMSGLKSCAETGNIFLAKIGLAGDKAMVSLFS